MSIDQITEYNIVFMHEFVMWTIYVILNHILVILLLLLKMTRLPWTISLNYFGDNFVQAWIEKWYQPWTIYVHVWIDKWCQPWTIYVILNHISVTVLLFWQVMSALNNWCHFEPYFGDTFVVLANDVSLEQFMSFWTIFKWQFCYFGKWCQPWMIHVILNHVLVTHYLNQQVMSALNNLCHYEPYFGDMFVILASDVSLEWLVSLWTIFRWHFCCLNWQVMSALIKCNYNALFLQTNFHPVIASSIIIVLLKFSLPVLWHGNGSSNHVFHGRFWISLV